MKPIDILAVSREELRLSQHEASLRRDAARHNTEQAIDALRAARAALHAAGIAYKAKEITLQDYANAQMAASEAKIAHAMAHAELLIADAEYTAHYGLFAFLMETGL